MDITDKHVELLKFFSKNEDLYFSANDLPELLLLKFDDFRDEPYRSMYMLAENKLLIRDENRSYFFKITPLGIDYLKSIKDEPRLFGIQNSFNTQNVETVYGDAIQSSDLRDSALTHKVTITPKINENNTNKVRWYNSTVLKYVGYPLIVLFIAWLVYFYFTGTLPSP